MTDVPVTKEMLGSVRQAHKNYKERVEAEKSEVLLMERKRKGRGSRTGKNGERH